MGKVISINNMQGGVGKTTIAINLSSAISRKRKRVLIRIKIKYFVLRILFEQTSNA